MIFSSLIFLFIFLPIILALYHLVCRRSILVKNLLLLFASLFFYAWGEPKFVLIMIGSIVLNYGFGRMVHRCSDQKLARVVLIISVFFNLGILFIFKYLNFTVNNLNIIFHNSIPQTSITLPIGISFFTFQAMSYVIDVYRGTVKVQRNLCNLALYISFFHS